MDTSTALHHFNLHHAHGYSHDTAEMIRDFIHDNAHLYDDMTNLMTDVIAMWE